MKAALVVILSLALFNTAFADGNDGWVNGVYHYEQDDGGPFYRQQRREELEGRYVAPERGAELELLMEEGRDHAGEFTDYDAERAVERMEQNDRIEAIRDNQGDYSNDRSEDSDDSDGDK
jgi:hypothetical protein